MMHWLPPDATCKNGKRFLALIGFVPVVLHWDADKGVYDTGFETDDGPLTFTDDDLCWYVEIPALPGNLSQHQEGV